MTSINDINSIDFDKNLVALDQNNQIVKIGYLGFFRRVLYASIYGWKEAFSDCNSLKVAEAIKEIAINELKKNQSKTEIKNIVISKLNSLKIQLDPSEQAILNKMILQFETTNKKDIKEIDKTELFNELRHRFRFYLNKNKV